MVSNTLNMELKDLLETLERLRRDSRDDAQYRELRSQLPADWPM
jgi:hypothetical protein